MRLSELLSGTDLSALVSSDPIIVGVTHDSRQVEPGFVFVAIPGIPMAGRAPLDGHRFIPAALERGAAAVVGTEPLELPVPYIRVSNPRAALADLSGAIFGHPERKLSLIGVTGSKGKTTTAVLLHHLLESAGVWAGRVSTVGGRFRGQEFSLPGHFTTPEAPQVFETLARFVKEGGTHAVLEVSSHALELDRVRGLAFDVGVWTNFSGDDHVDFHGSEAAYFAAKRRLLERSAISVLNRDDPSYAALSGFPHVAYSLRDHPPILGLLEWHASDLRESADGLRFLVDAPSWGFPAFVPMIGNFNVSNALAALMAAATVLFKRGFSNARVAETLQRGLKSFPGVPGRMQLLQASPFRVINDFAHTGASLRAALETLRSTAPTGRLILVVGAAGQRDPARRSGIGEAAARGTDLTVFTEEDHRTEALEGILSQMKSAYLAAGGDPGRLEVIADRREAIRRAVRLARAGDTVLLAGKGHERTLERGAEFLPWDENAEARRALEELR